MDGNVVALIVAVAGMVGTLISPVISQRLSARTRQEELEAQRLDSDAARHHVREQAVLQEKKATYIAFNAATRHYRVELMNYLHAVVQRTPDETDRNELHEARRAYSAAVAEMQIMAPDVVLSAVEEITSQLSSAYDAVKKLELGSPKPGWSFEESRDRLMSLWDLWPPLRQVIRADLGLEEGARIPARRTGTAALTPTDGPSPSA